MAWVRTVQQECRWSIWHMEFLKFQRKFLLNRENRLCTVMYQSRPINPLVKRISLISSQITVFLSLPHSHFCHVTQWALCCVTRIKGCEGDYLFLINSWTSLQRPPWGRKKVAIVKRWLLLIGFKQESMYGFFIRHCREVAITRQKLLRKATLYFSFKKYSVGLASSNV